VDLNEVYRVLRERWRIVISCLLLGLLGAGVVTMLVPPRYAAAVTMYVSAPMANPTVPGATLSQDAAYQGSLLAKARMQSYALLLTNDRITQPVINSLNLGISPAQLAGQITVSAVPDTVVLAATVTADQPARAADIANALAHEFVSLVGDLERPPGVTATDPAAPLPGQIAVQIVQPAVASPVPVAPRPPLNIAVGGLVGLLLGVAGAFVRNAVDPSVRSRDRLRAETGVPVLAAVPSGRRRRSPLIQPGARTPRAEAVRLLRTNLRFHGAGDRPGVIVVTGAGSGEGTTTTLCNLAIATADAGGRVLVVDADLRDPSVDRVLRVDASPGLGGVLVGDASVREALRTWYEEGLSVDVLPAGPVPDRPSELLAGPRLAELLKELRSDYDVVLVDTPGLLPVADAAAVTPLADGVLLVVRYGSTTWGQIGSAVEEITAVSGRLLGTVLTAAPGRSGRGRGRGRSERAKAIPAPADVPDAVEAEREVVRVPGWSHDLPSSRR
jgi:capsular exopolysaccharide synthesis family protein